MIKCGLPACLFLEAHITLVLRSTYPLDSLLERSLDFGQAKCKDTDDCAHFECNLLKISFFPKTLLGGLVQEILVPVGNQMRGHRRKVLE